MLCSYCQRSIIAPLFQTLDHIIPHHILIKEYGYGKNSYKVRSMRNLKNLLICCNECNGLKGKLTLVEFQDKLLRLLSAKIYPTNGQWLKPKLIRTILKSINVLLNNKSEPELIYIGNYKLILNS